jgi:hypothetical protein
MVTVSAAAWEEGSRLTPTDLYQFVATVARIPA